MAQLTCNIVTAQISKTDSSKTAKLKVSPPGKNFRMVHDGKKVLAIVEGGDRDVTKTGPQNSMVCFDTRQEIDDEVKKLGLEPLKEDPGPTLP